MLAMKEKLTRMTELVQENLSKAQAAQKTWYDKTARARSFEPGDRVLVLLPTSTNKLRAQWQGPYDIVRKQGEANYIVDMTSENDTGHSTLICCKSGMTASHWLSSPLRTTNKSQVMGMIGRVLHQ
jgi:hypothetical protein